MYLQNYPNNINLSQQQAVNHRGSHLLIVAGPGTGKTHTLTFRMIETVKRLKDHEKVLAITFTNKAAGEMRSRLNKRLWNAEDKTTIGTFHSFCLQFLRQYHDAANLPKEFRVIAPEECESISKELWPNQKQGARNKILERISEWKAIEFDEAPIAEVAVYNRKLREAGLLDFDDLLFETVRLLQGDSRILSEVQTTYPYVFVDEYQDINAIQQALLKILVGPQVELTAIGDPNQAIYGFRGSDVKFFENFAEDFPGTLTMSLSENYRSAQNLLSASGQVMAKSKSVYVPELTAKIYAQGQLTIYEAATDKAEAEYVVHQIEKMVGGLSMFSQDSGRVAREQESKRGCGEIAVLYRLNSQRLALQRRNVLATIAQPDVAQQLWSAAVAGGARASARRVAGLAAGERADFVVLASDATDGLTPQQVLASQLFAGHPGDAVREVWVGGRCRVKDGVHAAAGEACSRFVAARKLLLQQA